MSQASPTTNNNPALDKAAKGPRRRTLQSGFSLMSRGEPKIWLTGGMLVVCLAMIVSLLTLILVSGMATFWPGPIDWLLLNDGQMEIGEPQRSEVRAAGDAPATDTAGNRAAETAQPSHFYRTANFDVTNQHYRWLEPGQLSAHGIVRPEWALLIERQSWGRMLALPSRLTRPLTVTDSQSASLASAQALLQELATELEPLSSEEPVVPLTDLNAKLAQKIEATRAAGLRQALQESLKKSSTHEKVQWQSGDGNDWKTVTEPLGDDTSLSAARIVIDEPAAMLHELQPILAHLTQHRRETEQAMHSISLLDRDLSDARVGVRQAELDTGRSVLEKIDALGPALESLAANSAMSDRLAVLLTSIQPSLDDQQFQQIQQLLQRYQDKVLSPAKDMFEQEVASWKQQFVDEPETVRAAIERFAEAWKETLDRKRPLEARLQAAEQMSLGYELIGWLPTDAIALEMAAEDGQALLKGQWTEGAKAQLLQQSIKPIEDSTKATAHNAQAVQVDFLDESKGLVSLWARRSEDGNWNWLLPQQKALNCAEIVRVFPPNRLTLGGKLAVYGSRWSEFLLDNPREANTEGGVCPAIWGTIVMTLIMTLAVVPFGVIAALYLREYTRSGPIVSLVRISINNLAGVPSIVYGVFGLAFFCYSMGAFIDGGAKNAQFGQLPGGTWYMTLAGTVGVGVVAFLFSMLGSGTRPDRGWVRQRLKAIAPALWFISLIGSGLLIFKSPFFDGFYEARLPAPTFGKEGLLWASLTLALLTLPVVIVATEEALSAVPNSLREGSLACGASKWQTIYRIVLPHARPGILTGAILAMARGIGEVAPLMLVGALPVAPDLPLDGEFPYFHGSRSFMHLGYQIYWLGFQSQNSEASKPLVFTCTLLLILIVVSLNLAAILLRARLRRRFQGNQF